MTSPAPLEFPGGAAPAPPGFARNGIPGAVYEPYTPPIRLAPAPRPVDPPTCWYWLVENNDACGQLLHLGDDPHGKRWVCPLGHRLRQWQEVSRWVKRRLHIAQTDPLMIERLSEGRGGGIS